MKRTAQITLLISMLLTCVMPGFTQDRARSVISSSVASAVSQDPAYIPANSKVYVDEIEGFEGFENYLIAAFKKKKVPLIVVVDKGQADFVISGYSESKKAGWAKVIFGSSLPEEEASIQVVNLKTGVVAYAVASYKVNALNGKKSTAEHLAKNLRQKMERDDKRLKRT